MVQAVWNGQVIAGSESTVVVEGNHYFPRSSVRDDVLRESSHQSRCPWKGLASYFTLEVDGATKRGLVLPGTERGREGDRRPRGLLEGIEVR